MLIHDPGQDRLVDSLYVWVAIDPKTGLEGIASLVAGQNIPMQAVTSSKAIADKMRELYVALSRRTGKRFELRKFTAFEVIERLG